MNYGKKHKPFAPKNPSRPVNTLRTVRNPLAGLVVCSHCGRKNDPASLSEKRTASHAYLPLYRLSHRQQPPGSGRTSYPPWSAGVFKNYKANPDAVLSKSDTLIKSLEEVVQKHQNVLKALSCQKTRQYELLEQGNYTMDVFLERSEALAQQIAASAAALSEAEKNLMTERNRSHNSQNQMPKYGHLLSGYWNWDAKTRNDVLKELLEKVIYTKQTKTNTMKEIRLLSNWSYTPNCPKTSSVMSSLYEPTNLYTEDRHKEALHL